MSFKKRSITITFGDCAENHKGMQMIGKEADRGYTIQDLEHAKNKFEQSGAICELVDLNTFLPADKKAQKAAVLLIRKGVDVLLSNGSKDALEKNSDSLFNDLVTLDWDTKAFMYGRVVNKHARYNLCFSENPQEPDYVSKKGRIIEYDRVPLLKQIREKLPTFLDGADNLQGEGNFYYDVSKCGIGFHIDAERKKVVGVRLGASNPLHFQWYYNGETIGERCVLHPEHGDIYIMSEFAKGTQWRKKDSCLLRHAAGCDKYTIIKKTNDK